VKHCFVPRYANISNIRAERMRELKSGAADQRMGRRGGDRKRAPAMVASVICGFSAVGILAQKMYGIGTEKTAQHSRQIPK